MSGAFIGLWVDDVRPLPDDLAEAGWCCAPTFHEAILKLELMEFQSVSLDHDLGSYYGNKEMTGYDIVMWLVEREQQSKYVPPDIRIHSANPVGVANMQAMIDRYLKGE